MSPRQLHLTPHASSQENISTQQSPYVKQGEPTSMVRPACLRGCLPRPLSRVVLSRAVQWHLARRILCYANKTVIFA